MTESNPNWRLTSHDNVESERGRLDPTLHGIWTGNASSRLSSHAEVRSGIWYKPSVTNSTFLTSCLKPSVSTLAPKEEAQEKKGIEGKVQSDALRLVEAIWGSHLTAGGLFFEVQDTKTNRCTPLSAHQALDQIGSGSAKFFGPVPRSRAGNRLTDCLPALNVLWVDVDRAVRVDPVEVEDEVLPLLRSLGLHPSAVVYSGRAGLHLYWILDQSLDLSLIEGYNKRLAKAVGGDPACFNRNRILRLPGTLNEKPGGTEVTLRHLDPAPIPILRLKALGPVTPVLRDSNGSTKQPQRPGDGAEQVRLAAQHDHWGEIPLEFSAALTNIMLNFLGKRPQRGWTHHRYRSRSEMEMAITYRLVSKGWSDRHIQELADGHYPHHREWMARNPDDPNRYIAATLWNAREELLKRRGLITSPLGGHPRVAFPKKRRWTKSEDHQLRELASGQQRSDLVKEATRVLGRPRSTVYRRVSNLLKSGVLADRKGRIYVT